VGKAGTEGTFPSFLRGCRVPHASPVLRDMGVRLAEQGVERIGSCPTFARFLYLIH
jgi:hypothetical protein